METQILEEIGLNKTEAKIYLALTKLGQTTTTSIIKEARIHASKVYVYLDKLVQKGLVSYVIKSNKKYFSSTEPKFLKEMLKEKRKEIDLQEKKVDNLIPELDILKAQGKQVINFHIYEGLNGIKSVYEKILNLKNGETQYVIGAPRVGNEKIEGFLLDWHKRRVKKGIKCKYIYDFDAKDYGKVREGMKNTKVRYLPKNIASPTWIEIFSDHIFIGHIRGFNAVLFLIKDKEIARSYLDYFNLIWEESK